MLGFKDNLIRAFEECKTAMPTKEAAKLTFILGSLKYMSDICEEADYLRVPHKLEQSEVNFNKVKDFDSLMRVIDDLKDLKTPYFIIIDTIAPQMKKWRNFEFERITHSFNDIDFSKSILRGNYGGVIEELIEVFYKNLSGSDGVIFNDSDINILIKDLLKIKEDETLIDPCIGFGNMAFAIGDKTNEISGYEIDEYVWAVSKISHSLANLEGDISLVDSLREMEFMDPKDVLVSFPPMNVRRRDEDPFAKYNKWGEVPVKRSSDLAFLSMCLELSKKRGAIIIPDGALFRGGSEGKIRSNIITEKYIEAIISLPSGAISYSSIKTDILIFNKEKKNESILFIDGEEFFKKTRGGVSITDKSIEAIVSILENKFQKKEISKMVSVEKILKNGGILNVNRYVTPVIKTLDINEATKNLKQLKKAKDEYENKTDELYKKLFGK